ncbi:MAG: acyl-CoA thioesterase [Bdellovibrio sp.]|nr:acyl-CoA thioesterase [Bdellovibrio sp.]
MKKSKTVASSQVIMTQLVLPVNTNALDTVFGGQVMAWIDIVAAIAAQRHSGSEVVTASIDQLSFVAPIKKGWVANLKASVNFVSRTSMEIGVRVEAENPKTGELFLTTAAYLTFVAVGDDGHPVEVPGLILETDIQKRRFAAAQKRRELRLANR